MRSSSIPVATPSYIPTQIVEAQQTISLAFQVMQFGDPHDKFKVAVALAANVNHFLQTSPNEHAEARLARVLLKRINPEHEEDTLSSLSICVSKFSEIQTFLTNALLATTNHETALTLRNCLKHSTLPPASPEREAVERRATAYPIAGPFDHFLQAMTRREEPRFPALGILFSDLSTGARAISIREIGNPKTNELLSKFFGTLLDESTFLQVFGLMDGAYRVHSCDLTYHPDKSVHLAIKIYTSTDDDIEGHEAAHFEATISQVPTAHTTPWIATITEAATFMKGGKIALSLFIGWAAFLRTVLHVDEITIPEAHGDAPLWAEHVGFTYQDKEEILENIKRDLETEITEDLDPEDPQRARALRLILDANSLQDIAAIQINKKISGKETIRKYFSPSYPVSMKLNIRRANMRRDPLPRLIQEVTGTKFIPVEIAILQSDSTTKATADDFLHHHGNRNLDLMQSDEDLAQAIVERLYNWATQAHKPEFLRYIVSMLHVVQDNIDLTDSILKIIIARSHADLRSAHVFADVLVKAAKKEISIATPFLKWAENLLRTD